MNSTYVESVLTSRSMSNAIGSKRYEINSFLVNPQARLGLYALLNMLQDAGWYHATLLGHGHEVSLARNRAFWVLTRQHLVMKEWPAWGEHLDITTWIRPITGAIATRDFSLSVGGRTVGEATSGFILLDAETRRPLKDGAASLDFEARSEGVLTLETPKIPPLEMTTSMAKFQVRNSDIDMNDHVNNTRYAQWILDAMPMEWHRTYKLEDYQINFLIEAKLGDAVDVRFVALEGDETTARTKLQFQGFRESDGKVIFAAALESSRR
jgi:medium-chain acyl-[acyl-carrier-protein] hydrolase